MFKEIKDTKNGGNMTFKKFSEIKKNIYSELLAINSQDRFHKLLSHDDTRPILFIQAIS